MPLKKFTTQGEEFFDFLKSLGYQPPKHQKGEHYDYLFQDEEVCKKIKIMMRKIKPHNIVGKEELLKFQLLKDDGMVLYGKDLETAMEREKALERKMEEDIISANAKETEWCSLIQDKKSSIENLSALNDLLNTTIEAQQIEDNQKKQLIAKWEAESSNLNKEILIDRKMLFDKVDELQSTLENIVTPTTFKSSKRNPSSLIDLDWMKLMDDEDKLMNMIKPMVEKYGTDLIRKTSGEEGDSVIGSEGIQKVFLQYAKDFERLKHSMIYEKIKETENNELLAGDTGACEKLDECLQQIERLSHIDDVAVLKKIKNEMHEETDRLEQSLQIENERAIDHIKNLVINELNEDIKELVDLKAQAKKNLKVFLEFVVEVLSVQKVRVDIIRELSKTEGRDVEKLARQLYEQKERLNYLQHKQELITEGITEDKLSPDGHRLFDVFKKFDIPLSVLESHTNTMVSLSAIRNQVTIGKLKTFETSDKDLRCFSQKLTHKHNILKDLYEKVRTRHVENEEESLILSLEKTHEDLEKKLAWHAENKQQIVQDNITKKWAAMKRIQMALSKTQNYS